MKKVTDDFMQILANKVDCTYDGSCTEEIDARIHLDEDKISVYANIMSKKDYNKMEKDIIKTNIKGKNYLVYAWNDSSGYAYWKNAGENYIQITASIENQDIDAEKLKKDILKLNEHFWQYENSYEGTNKMLEDRDKKGFTK